MRTFSTGALYVFQLANGDWGEEYLTHVQTSRGRVETPGEGVNALQGVVFNGQLFMAGQGGTSGACWLWNGATWQNLGHTHGVRPCAFGVDSLYFSNTAESYIRISLATGETVAYPRTIGSQGIRYVDGTRIVPGDATLFDGTVHEWIQRGDVRAGQGHEGGYLVNGRVLEPGDVQFGTFDRQGDALAFGIVKFKEGGAVRHTLSRSDVDHLPLPTVPIPGTPVPNTGTPDPPKEPMPTLEAPNQIETVRRVMAEHPEINTRDEATRGNILPYICDALGGFPWGRKSRNAEGTDLNTDALTFRRQDNLFEIYDVISGANGGATWDGFGPFKQGENGYWVAAQPVEPTEPPDEPPDTPPSTDIADLQAAIKSLLYSLARQDEQVTNLTRRVTNLEQRPTNLTLPKLRVKGSTSRDLYHAHRIDLEVVPE